jgi:hypothetical protein
VRLRYPLRCRVRFDCYGLSARPLVKLRFGHFAG